MENYNEKLIESLLNLKKEFENEVVDRIKNIGIINSVEWTLFIDVEDDSIEYHIANIEYYDTSNKNISKYDIKNLYDNFVSLESFILNVGSINLGLLYSVTTNNTINNINFRIYDNGNVEINKFDGYYEKKLISLPIIF